MFNLLFDSKIESRIDKNGRKYLFIKLKDEKPSFKEAGEIPSVYGYLLYNFEGRVKLKFIMHRRMINKYSKKEFVKYSIWDQYIFEQHKGKTNVIIKLLKTSNYRSKNNIKAWRTLKFDTKQQALDKLFKYSLETHDNIKIITAFVKGSLKEKWNEGNNRTKSSNRRSHKKECGKS